MGPGSRLSIYASIYHNLILSLPCHHHAWMNCVYAFFLFFFSGASLPLIEWHVHNDGTRIIIGSLIVNGLLFIHHEMRFCCNQVESLLRVPLTILHLWLLEWPSIRGRRLGGTLTSTGFCCRWCPISGRVVNWGVCRRVLLLHPCLL